MTSIPLDENAIATEVHIKNPVIGDRFHEMYSYWICVLDVADTWLVFEDTVDQKPVFMFKDKFEKKLSYGTIPGYWVRYHDTKYDATAWSRNKSIDLIIATLREREDVVDIAKIMKEKLSNLREGILSLESTL